jgi:hypothetical protein
MSNLDRFNEFCERWSGKRVQFKLLGQWVEGEVIEILDTVCAPHFIVAEFRDGAKQVKVGAPYQAFRRLPD